MNKLYTTIALLSATVTSHALLVVNGDFNNDTQLIGKAGGATIVVGDLDGGWIAHNQTGRSFNSVTSGVSAMFQFNSPNGSPDGFFLGSNDSNNNQGTAWNLFSGPNPPISQIQLDVAVLQNYTDNQGNPVSVIDALLTNPTNVSLALYGFNGTEAQLTTALTNAAIESRNNTLGVPASEFITINTQTLSAASGFDTWETQTFSIGAPQKFDYLLFGITGLGSAIEGVGIDNVSIVAVPEPSVYIGLIGFAAMGLFIYRRKMASKKSSSLIEASNA